MNRFDKQKMWEEDHKEIETEKNLLEIRDGIKSVYEEKQVKTRGRKSKK